jgi:two-component system chemotaxis response regulator CheY
LNILSVDDVLVVRKIIKRVVESMGGSLLEASSGLEAFEILAKDHQTIDLILLDQNMPHMDGFEFLVKMKGDDRYRHIPVIMVTNENEKEKVIKAVQAGASNYLSKPFSEEDLTRKIVDCLGLGYETMITRCLAGSLVRMLEYTTGTEVAESKAAAALTGLTPGWLFGQTLIIGQKKAVIFISMSSETADSVFRATFNKEADPDMTPAGILGDILRVFLAKASEALSEANARVGLLTPFSFTGALDSNSYAVQNAKTFSTARKYSSAGLEIDLRIIYFN